MCKKSKRRVDLFIMFYHVIYNACNLRDLWLFELSSYMEEGNQPDDSIRKKNCLLYSF